MRITKFSLIFILLIQINSYSTPQNEFSINLVDENIKGATYIYPAKDEDNNIYFVTGEDGCDGPFKKYIVKYNMILMDVVEKYSYDSQICFDFGEAYVVGNNNYLFVSMFFADQERGKCEFVNIRQRRSSETNYNYIHGYKRFLKKVENYYFLANYLNFNSLLIQKMGINYSGDFPSFYEIARNSVNLEYECMLSCGLTSDSQFILCAYFSTNKKATISVFNNNLDHKLTEEFDDWIDLGGKKSFIKIVNFRENSNFFLANRQTDSIIRFRYFKYEENSPIIDLLNDITGNRFIDIEKNYCNSHYGANDMIAFDRKKIIQLFGGWSNHLTITIFHFDDDNSLSIKIYNTNINNEFSNIQRPRLVKLENSFIVCLSASKDGIQRPGFFVMNFPNVKNETLSENNIELTNLIFIENKLFSLKQN